MGWSLDMDSLKEEQGVLHAEQTGTHTRCYGKYATLLNFERVLSGYSRLDS